MSNNALVLVSCSNINTIILAHHSIGHWCLWIPWVTRGRSTCKRGISRQRVRKIYLAGCDLVAYSTYAHSTVRSAKVAANKEAFSVYGDAVDIFGWDDLVGGTYPDAFKGIVSLTQ